MKLNWGTGIAIFYGAFMAIMIFAVIFSAKNKSDLVVEEYYKDDINYESFRVKRQNSNQLEKTVDIEYQRADQAIQFVFPQDMPNVQGHITFFRPSDKRLDRRFPISLNDLGKMVIKKDRKLVGGLWKVKVEWQNDGKDYYYEKPLVL